MKRLLLPILCIISLVSTGQQNLRFFDKYFIKTFDNQLAQLSDSIKSKNDLVILNSYTGIEYYRNDNDNFSKAVGTYLRMAVLSSEGILYAQNVTIPAGQRDNLIASSLKVINPDGSFKSFELTDFKEVEKENGLEYIHALEGLSIGAEIEFYYCLKSNTQLYGSIYFENTLFQVNKSVELISPIDIVFSAKAYNTGQNVEETENGSLRTLKLSLQNIEKYEAEKYALEDADKIRFDYSFTYNSNNQATTLQTWNNIANSVKKALLAEKEDCEKQFVKIIKAEKLVGEDPEQTVRNIENFVKSNINIDSEAPPAPLQDVFKNKFTSEFGAQKLFATLFELSGIEYEVICGLSKMDKKFDPELVSWGSIDALFFYFPFADKYLNPKNSFIRLGFLESQYTGVEALFIQSLDMGGVKATVGIVQEISEPDYNTNADQMDITVDFNNEVDQLIINYERTLAGQLVNDLKGYFTLSTSDEQEQLKENIFKSFLKEDIEIVNATVSNTNLNSDEWEKPISFIGVIESKAFIEKAGSKIFVKVGELIGMQTELYAENQRKYDINIGNQHGYLRKIKVNIPTGYEVSNLQDINKKFSCEDKGQVVCDFISNYTMEGKSISMNVNETYYQTKISKSLYPSFQKVINAAADWNKVVLVLQKK